MKKLIIPVFILAIGLFATSSRAETYEGTVSGIGCIKCKQAIAKAFSNVQGIKSIRFIDPEKDGELHKMVVETSSGSTISEEKAVGMLKGSKFTIKKWERRKVSQ